MHVFKLIRQSGSFLLIATICSVPLVVDSQSPEKDSSRGRALYVGLIEDDRRQLNQLHSGDTGLVSGRVITPAFRKNLFGWEPLQQLNLAMHWTVAFDGKKLGEVDSRPVSPADARPKGVLGPTSMHSILGGVDQIPTAGKSSGDFSGNYSTEVRRPLVVVSAANYTDPDHWKRVPIPEEIQERVRRAFHERFQHVKRCDSLGEPLSHDANPGDLGLLVLKSYGSKANSFIAETKLKNRKCVFNAVEKKLELLEGDQWFYVDSSGRVQFLGRDWDLVDAGDYDGDGKSEVIFYVSESEDDAGIETEGYILYWNDFSKSARFTWDDYALAQ